MDAISTEPGFNRVSPDTVQSVFAIISRSRDVWDASLAMDVWCSRWRDMKVLSSYVQRNGLDTPIFLELAIALRMRYEIWVLAHFAQTEILTSLHLHLVLFDLHEGVWTSARSLDPNMIDARTGEVLQLELWAEIYKLRCVALSHPDVLFIQGWPDGAKFRDPGLTWQELCLKKIPGPEHAKFREQLSRLEDTLRDEMREQWPSLFTGADHR